MNIVSSINEWRALQKQWRDKKVGFVPTMGNLHAGHISLCERSRQENDVTVVSVFVNPTQFNQARDLERYPRTLEQDKSLLAAIGVDYLFVPNAEEIYADHYQVQVSETDLAKELEGEFRPGHFNGMLTVVLKLLNIIQANRAYFGEKDYQQLLLVQKMVRALFMPVEIIACETVRAPDGLALSSRNSRLNANQRELAVHFPQLLQSANPVESIIEQLKGLGFKVDYVTEKWHRRLGAVWLDDVRLIDNIAI